MRIFLCFIVVAVCYLNAQSPEWVKNQGRSVRYPSNQFLTGYGVSYSKDQSERNNARDRAISSAKVNLIEKIRVKIQSVTSTQSEEDGDSYSSLFSSTVQSTSNVEISGLLTETFEEDGPMTHALVFVPRKNVVSIYDHTVRMLKGKIKTAVSSAVSLEQQSKRAEALKEYLSCLPLMRDLEESQAILASISEMDRQDEIEDNDRSKELNMVTIRTSIQRLIGRPVQDVDDAAWFLSYQVTEQIKMRGQTKSTLLIVPVQHQDSRMGSPFSRYFQTVLEQRMSTLPEWNVVQQSPSDYILNGTYWTGKDGIKVIVYVRDVKHGTIIASAEAMLPTEVVAKTDRSILPENYLQALSDRKIFANGESAGGGLTVEAWTNKETLGNLFVEKEKMKVVIRVNLPCYIRFIYHMANGKRVLLFNEYYMDASKVNIPYEIPQTFISMPPFGSEVLQIIAQTERFTQFKTQSQDGFEYIIDDLQTIVQQTRGMKKEKPDLMQAEERITITTMKEDVPDSSK
jgi:hypothetical protein